MAELRLLPVLLPRSHDRRRDDSDIVLIERDVAK